MLNYYDRLAKASAIRHRALLATICVLVMVISGCTSKSPSRENTSATGLMANNAHVQAEPVIFDAQMQSEIEILTNFGSVIVGTPMSFTIDGIFPEEGVLMTKTYAVPLPENVSATLVFWDAAYETWVAVPSETSADRRTVSATVQHFSIWVDVFSGPVAEIDKFRRSAVEKGQKVVDGATDVLVDSVTNLHYYAGKVLSTRVSPPECEQPAPEWVEDAIHLEDKADPILFCVGGDPRAPGNVLVKARVNRGFGFTATILAPNQGVRSGDGNSVLSLVDVIGDLPTVMGDSVSRLLGDGYFVGPGGEVEVSFSRQDLLSHSESALLMFEEPTAVSFLVSLIAASIVEIGSGGVEGTTAAVLMLAACTSNGASFATDDNVSGALGSFTSCLMANRDYITSLVVDELVSAGIIPLSEAPKVVGRWSARLTVSLTIVSAALDTFDFMGVRTLPPSALSVYLRLSPVSSDVDESKPYVSCLDPDIDCDDYGNVLGENESIKCGDAEVVCDDMGEIIGFKGRPVRPDPSADAPISSLGDITPAFLQEDRWCPEAYPTECFFVIEDGYSGSEVAISDTGDMRDVFGAYVFAICSETDVNAECPSHGFLGRYVLVPAGELWDCDGFAVEYLGYEGCDGAYAYSDQQIVTEHRLFKIDASIDGAGSYWDPGLAYYRESIVYR